LRLVTNILLFLLPFAVFFSYAYFANKNRAVNGGDPLRTPWYWLIIAGLALGIAGFFAMRVTADPHRGCYVRAHVDANGKVVDGYFSDDPDHADCAK
jgi:hypothetical protein